jgi:hypothetical protein
MREQRAIDMARRVSASLGRSTDLGTNVFINPDALD